MRKLIIIGCILCYMGLLKIPLSLAEWAMAIGGDTGGGRSRLSRHGVSSADG